MHCLDAAALGSWPLPIAHEGSDKEQRGHVLVVAGGREIPGAALLAATAALRAGAGKLTIATVQSVAAGLSLAVPEARVIALRETPAGGPAPDSVMQLEACAAHCAAVLVGPGLPEGPDNEQFVGRLVAMLGQTPVLLDASAMDYVLQPQRTDRRILITPHAGEMAHLSGRSKHDVLADAAATAGAFAQAHRVVVVLKGADTYLATPQGSLWHHHAAIPGLATSGSGDVLAGLMTGMLARGADMDQAAAWGVVVHARAGLALADRHGPLGFLARELLDQIPAVVRTLCGDCPAPPSCGQRQHGVPL